MRFERLQATMIVAVGIGLLGMPASWAADTTFEQFQEQLRRQFPPLERLPTPEMLKDEPNQAPRVETLEEAQRRCDAVAVDMGLRTCEARQTTVQTPAGAVDYWHCMCR